jgi:hypothetical protein
MAPPLKKTKKKMKRKSKGAGSKLGRKRAAPLEPVENRALETEWWYAFQQKISDAGNYLF